MLRSTVGGIKQWNDPSVRLSVCPVPLAQNGALSGYGYYRTEH